MKFGLIGSHRRRFWIILKALSLGAALCWATQAHAQSCYDMFASIRSAAKYCGFFCDQDELRPLQAAYESKCIVRVIPASLLQFDSSSDASTALALNTKAQSEEAASPHPVLRESQRLLETVRAIDTPQFASTAWRKSAAEAALSYCKSAVALVPYNAPRVGLMEESAGPTGMRLEFARWQLTKIFVDCTEFAHDILDAQDVQREAGAWIKLTRLLEHDQTVRKLGTNAELLQPVRDAAAENDIFGTDNWRTTRLIILEAVAKLLGEP